MTEVKFYDTVEDSLLRFAVIITVADGKLVFCKHAKRDTYEETGALDYKIVPVCVYSVTAPDNFDGQESFGMLYFAEVYEFEGELHNEIEKIIFTAELPEEWTYPEIQPRLLEEAVRRGYNI